MNRARGRATRTDVDLTVKRVCVIRSTLREPARTNYENLLTGGRVVAIVRARAARALLDGVFL